MEKSELVALKNQYKEMWDKGEFEWNHHEGDDLYKKPISPWRIWNSFIEPMFEKHRQKGVDGERLRIKNLLNKYLSFEVYGSTVYFQSQAVRDGKIVDDYEMFINELNQEKS